MFDFHEKRRIRSMLYSKPVVAVIFLAGILLASSVHGRYIVARDMEKKLEERQQELQALQIRATTIKEKVDYLHNERGIEEELRNRFDVARQGEEVVVLVDQKNHTQATQTALQSTATAPSAKPHRSFADIFKFW